VLTPSLRVTDSQIQKSDFSQAYFIFMVFHSFPEIIMVANPNLFSNPISFSVRLPVVISVATDGDSAGEARESSHLIRYANWMWFFLMFSFLFIFICLLLSLFSCVYICLLE